MKHGSGNPDSPTAAVTPTPSPPPPQSDVIVKGMSLNQITE